MPGSRSFEGFRVLGWSLCATWPGKLSRTVAIASFTGSAVPATGPAAMAGTPA